MEGKVQVLERVEPGAVPGLAHHAIDRPAAGWSGAGWTLDVRGSAVGEGSPVASVEFHVEGRVIHIAPCDVPRPVLAGERPDLAGAAASGFYATLSALDLPTGFDLHLRALRADGVRIHFGTLRGTRAAIESGFEPSLQPLIVSGPGRSGSTIFMQMLAGHPGIVAWPPFDEEPRVLTYWIEVLRTLARPESFLRQVAPAGDLNFDWWLGRRDPRPRALSDADVQGWLGGAAVAELAAFAQARVEALYGRVGDGDRKGARYFAEKLRNDPVSDLAWELYPAAREVVLVRDPRDVLVSVLATISKRGERPPPADTAAWIEEQFRPRIAAVVESWTRRRDRALLVRYEDLMTDPQATLAGVLSYLDLDTAGAAVEAMLASAGEALPGMDRHRTTATAAASIGRWREDLEPALAERCEAVLGDAIAALGYASASAQA